MPTSLATASSDLLTATSEAKMSTISMLLNAVRPQRKEIKGGLTLVFDSGLEGPDEMSMEEMRASLGRYQKMLLLRK